MLCPGVVLNMPDLNMPFDLHATEVNHVTPYAPNIAGGYLPRQHSRLVLQLLLSCVQFALSDRGVGDLWPRLGL